MLCLVFLGVRAPCRTPNLHTGCMQFGAVRMLLLTAHNPAAHLVSQQVTRMRPGDRVVPIEHGQGTWRSHGVFNVRGWFGRGRGAGRARLRLDGHGCS